MLVNLSLSRSLNDMRDNHVRILATFRTLEVSDLRVPIPRFNDSVQILSRFRDQANDTILFNCSRTIL